MRKLIAIRELTDGQAQEIVRDLRKYLREGATIRAIDTNEAILEQSEEGAGIDKGIVVEWC